MLATISIILQAECALDKERLLVVGVSGGPDSMCLLDLLHKFGYRLLVAHVNHQLRSAAGAEQELVEQAAARRGLAFVSTVVDVLGYADLSGIAVEEAARNLRYRFLFDQAVQNHAQAVIVGHHADDQVETVLMHLLRGSGLGGLRGMPLRALPNPWSDEVPLVRPLLRTWRKQIEDYCLENGLETAQDHSNLEPLYTRNRVRLELLPLLESIQPGARGSLLRLARLVREEDEFLQEAVRAAWNNCLLQENPQFVALDLPGLQAQPVVIQRRLLRMAAETLRPGLIDIGFDDIERALQFIRQPSQTNQVDWTAGMRLSLEGKKLWVACWEASLPVAHWPQLLPDQVINLSVPGTAHLPSGWLLQVTPVQLDIDQRQSALLNKHPYQTWLDLERLELPLTLRARRSGDRFQPLGMNGQSVNLKDWMIKHKLPQRARTGWPLLCSGEQIVWIPGFHLAHPARITHETRHILHVSLSKSEH